MSNLFDKDNRIIIKTMNTHMGTEHRSMPYDLNNPNDLKHALQMTVAAYRDYRQYERVLFKLIEDFDESLENYDTISWFNLGCESDKVENLAMDCVAAINTASVKFSRIADRAKEDFSRMLKIILSLPPETQRAVIGTAYKVEPQDMDEKIDELIDLLDEAEYQYKILDNFDTLLKVMAEIRW